MKPFDAGQGCGSAPLSGIECPSLSFSPAAGARGHVAPRGGRPDRLMSEQIWDSASVWLTRCWLEVRCIYHCFLRPEGKTAGRLIKGLKGLSGFTWRSVSPCMLSAERLLGNSHSAFPVRRIRSASLLLHWFKRAGVRIGSSTSGLCGGGPKAGTAAKI